MVRREEVRLLPSFEHEFIFKNKIARQNTGELRSRVLPVTACRIHCIIFRLAMGAGYTPEKPTEGSEG